MTRSFQQITRDTAGRGRASAEAWRAGACTLAGMARYFGIYLSTVNQIVRRVMDAQNKT